MAFFSDMQAALDALRAVCGDDVDAVEIPAVVRRLADEGVVGVIQNATVLVRGAESVRIAASGAVASRSTRDDGHEGLAQQRGHRSSVTLIQDLTGTSRADAARQVRLGEALAAGLATSTDTDVADESGTDASANAGQPKPRLSRPWHAALGDALMIGALTSAQHDAIFRGLGEPPVPTAEVTDELASEEASALAATAIAAWGAAVSQLIDEAADRTVEELASAARTIRDLLDPLGAQRRFEGRFEARSFRMWTDRDGTRRGTISFDDEMGAWVQTVIDTALRPRRGGPRFVDADEAARAKQLADDPRTNDQLTYDLIMDTFRAGALAEAESVFGARQAGIRIVATAAALGDAVEDHPAVALLEDSDITLPGWLIAQLACHTGMALVSLDSTGNPLDVGREERLFTAKQRIALAIRDGGCRAPGCDRPASYCEAHHIDPYAEGGCTDIDRGILLCRFHHMQLHHGGWRITRTGKGEFMLHIPGSAPPIPLPTRLPRRYAWGDLQPPPRRFLPAA